MLSWPHLQVAAIATWQTHILHDHGSGQYSQLHPYHRAGVLGQQRCDYACRTQSRSTQQQSNALLSVAAVLSPASLILSSTRPCELWLDPCFLRQRTTFQSSQASNLLGFIAMEPLSSTPCHGSWAFAPLRAVRHLKSRHQFVPAAQQLITSSDDDNNIGAALWADHWWSSERSEKTYKTPCFHPWHWHPPSRNGPAKNSVSQAMGIRRIFFRRANSAFFKVFLWGPKVVKFRFSHSKVTRQLFLLKISKSRGSLGPLPPFRRPLFGLNRLRTGVGRFRSCSHKWSMAPFAA